MRDTLKYLSVVHIDTCHAVFRFDQPLTESLPLMTMYELVVVDEISLLDCPQFEHIAKLWSAAEKTPALVILGDKYQLPGVGNTRPWESAIWKRGCAHRKLAVPQRI